MGEDNKELQNYTRLFNPILEALCRQSNNLTSSEYAILLFIIRSTYGWQKKNHPISTTLIIQKTGITESTVKRSVKRLIERGYIIDFGIDQKSRCKVLGLNKKYSQWNAEGVTDDPVISGQLRGSSECKMRGSFEVKEGVTDDPQKKNISKDTLSKEKISKDMFPKKTIFFSSTGIEYESIKDGYGIWKNEKGEVKWEPIEEGKEVEVDGDL